MSKKIKTKYLILESQVFMGCDKDFALCYSLYMYAQADTSVSFAHMTPCDNRLFNIKCLCFLYMILLDKFLYSQ